MVHEARDDAPSSLRILMVEDDRIIALAQSHLLQERSYTVTAVHSGEEAVRQVADHPDSWDLILMDIDLGPGMDGTRAAATILERLEIPIVFLTSHSEEAMVERVKGITRYGYVLKNSGEFVLVQAIEMAMELFALKRESDLREERYRAITNLTGEIIVQHGTDARWTYLNDRACEFFGGTRDDLVGRDFMDFVHPDDANRTSDSMHQVIAGVPVRGSVNRQQSASGWRVVDWNSEIIRDAYGTIAGFQATGRDITDHIRTEQLLGKVMDASPAGIVVVDRNGTISYANQNAMRVLGLTASEAAGRAFTDPQFRITDAGGELIQGEELPFQRVRSSGEVVRDFEHAIVRPDGTRVLLSITSAPLLDEHNEFDGTVSILEDVTERRENEARLRDRDAKLRGISANMPGFVYQYELLPDGSSRFPFVSESVEGLLGYTAASVMEDGSILQDAVHPEDRQKMEREIRESSATLSPYSVVHRIVRSDGEFIWISAQSTPMRSPDGSTTWVGVAVDISARMAAENRARALASEKDLLLREVHHRIKNDIALIRALVNMQHDRVESEEARNALKETLSRLSAIGAVYENLHQTGDAERVPLAEIVRHQVALYRARAPRDQAAVEVLVDDLEVSPRLAVSVGIVLNELVTNSMKHSGSHAGPVALSVTSDEPRKLIRLEIRDRGPGYPPEVLAGSYGFGLTVVSALARQHDGALRLLNDGGASCEIILSTS